MKRLIALLLLSPALASATDSPCMQGCNLFINAGSMTVNNDDARFNASGPGFTASGGWAFLGGPAPNGAWDISPGQLVSISWGENCDGFFTMGITVGGFSYSTGSSSLNGEPCGFGSFQTTPVTITGAGTYKTSIDFGGFVGSDGCVTNCEPVNVFGHGIGTLLVVPEGDSGLFFIPNATFTFTAPEPSAASLLLLGFAGLAVLGWRRRARATLLVPT